VSKGWLAAAGGGELREVERREKSSGENSELGAVRSKERKKIKR
jgi:hypothetical protein